MEGAAGGASGGSKKAEAELSSMGAQISELVSAVQTLTTKADSSESRLAAKIVSQVSRIDDRLDSLSKKVKSLEAGGGDSGREEVKNPDKHIICSKCGQKGHRAANCPGKQE